MNYTVNTEKNEESNTTKNNALSPEYSKSGNFNVLKIGDREYSKPAYTPIQMHAIAQKIFGSSTNQAVYIDTIAKIKQEEIYKVSVNNTRIANDLTLNNHFESLPKETMMEEMYLVMSWACYEGITDFLGQLSPLIAYGRYEGHI